MLPCCSYLTSMIFFLWTQQRFAESSPLIERRAPVVFDAITSNDTLEAARNAFLINHLFTEFEEEEKKKGFAEKNKPKPIAASEVEETGLYGELVEGDNAAGDQRGSDRGDKEERKSLPVAPIQPQVHQMPLGSTTTTTAKITTKLEPVNEEEEREERGEEPIRSVNDNPAKPTPQRHLGDGEEQTINEGEDVLIMRPTAADQKEDPAGQVEQTSMPSSTITSQKEDEEDATNPFVYPPTLHPEEDADHMPGWLRALFFTTLCTAIGFFLLMLLIGLLGRFEGGASSTIPQREPPRRVVRLGDARVVPIIEEEAVVVVRPSAH